MVNSQHKSTAKTSLGVLAKVFSFRYRGLLNSTKLSLNGSFF